MWYIGQKIVAIENHVQGSFKEGDIFTIKSLMNSPCKCNFVLIDIGMISQKGLGMCQECNATYTQSIRWFSEKRFSPLDEIQAHESAVNELLQELNLQIQ